MTVILSWSKAIASRRNNGFCSFCFNRFYEVVCVISFVSNHYIRIRSFDQGVRLSDIRLLATCQNIFHRVAQGIY